MSKVTLSNIGNLADTTTAQTTINNNNDTIMAAFDDTISRHGTLPNAMVASLDMNLFQILNLPAPATGLSPLRLQDLSTFVGGGTVTNIPPGGNANQVLAKSSGVDFATAWVNAVTSVGLSLPADFTVSNSPVTTSGILTAIYTNTPTGTGGFVRATSPTLVTPVIGVATGTSLNLSGLTASSAVATDGSKNLVSVTNTGTGNNVLATSPTLTTPIIASIVNTGTLTLPTSTDTLIGKATADILTNKTFDTAGAGNVFKINGVTITANTGTGSNVLATSPTLVTPALGTPTAGVLTSCTGLPLTTGITGILGVANGGVGVSLSATGGTNQVLLQQTVGGNITVSQLAASNLADGVTGTGTVVRSTSPTLVTPTLGVASATALTLANGTSNGLQFLAASGSNGALAMGAGGSMVFVLGSTAGTFSVNDHVSNTVFNVSEGTPGTASTTTAYIAGNLQLCNITAIPAGGTAGKGLLMSSTSNFGTFFGSGAPTLAAAKGSQYLRSDGSSTSTRMYINTDGSTTWTNVVTAA